MKRKDFIKKSAASLIFVNSISIFEIFPTTLPTGNGELLIESNNVQNSPMQKSYEKLVSWMRNNGWIDLFEQVIERNKLDLIKDNLFLPIDNIEMIRSRKDLGFDDFGGNKLIEPGYPSLSLLYHSLASPRVKDPSIASYPSLEHLDLLENYIYSLKKFDEKLLESPNRLFSLAVLSYEYRPAYKTPTLNPDNSLGKCAQIVYSRTGLSRIGDKNYNYDPENRCFTNKPIQHKDEKNIAVTPARYGLFLVELVDFDGNSSDSVKLMNYQGHERTNLGPRFFIRPIRKVYEDSNTHLQFGEYHINEKLKKFSKFKLDEKKFSLNDDYDLDQPPFTRINSSNDKGEKLEFHSNDESMVHIKRQGSSVLLIPDPQQLVKIATQGNRKIAFSVPEVWEANNQSNRRYNALKVTDKKTKEVYDAIFTDFIFRRNRRTSRFRAPKNAPLFVNIKHELIDGEIQQLELESVFEKKILKGSYFAQLFEDNISDGCISAKVDFKNKSASVESNQQSFLSKFSKVMPAFSLVTAPDFFPSLDSNDIRCYYMAKNLKMDEHFLEGGTINLSGIRQRGNPKIIDPFSKNQAFEESSVENKSFDTMTAVVSNNFGSNSYKSENFNLSFQRKYSSSSYLPDTGTGIFYPGWDITYSTEPNNPKNPFFASYGLGSPFPEDMKLCAAANGMWPVVSPDAGRTFQGSLEPFPILGKPNTAIPLMDDEIGIHKNSPKVKNHILKESYGWDGEQGPFLQFNPESKNELVVNFTDIGRADYIGNIINSEIGFDMSRLRKLDSTELILRLDSLRAAIKSFDKKKVQYTKYWLISAEKIENWNSEIKAHGLPINFIEGPESWLNYSNSVEGSGYLFIFALTEESSLDKELESEGSKRRNQKVIELCICKVSNKLNSETVVQYCKIKGSFPQKSSTLKWRKKLI